MRGKKVTPKKEILPDPKYNNIMVAKFINHIMRKGKKTTAQKIVYGCFDILKEKVNSSTDGEKKNINVLDVFDKAFKNIAPILEVRGRRIGGANYQVPTEVRGGRKITLGLRWLIQAARAKKGKSMKEKLVMEILDALNNTGSAIKKKEDVYRMAQANRAFAHFAKFNN
ncbi:30S ribosomal protein S7 [Candidatus Kuenenbacteria bacterium HGW-Kuenenbacteria-1]|uniref:Small ribosomal subunit protein uS7 n=1 Tax=Candidatus Kuenenbacteria bacterium HGW-Kuenenbacteria-1 TaxID=2013812 RepID=A0A2N1UN86_9BACT|nr:MAG: 30S ribosomal protein S7 [Candidatus Kuenenbacteria bacterium HGW-Kuenenbacteria-1]